MSWPYPLGAVVHGEADDVFVLIRRLGEGSSAFVYEADDLRRGVRVALKLQRVGAPPTRLRRERAALCELFHPNIVRLHAFGMTRDARRIPYLATTLLAGASLRAVLTEQGALGLERAVDYGIDLFDALAAAQEIHIAHRDVRPENAFVERVAPRVHRLVLHDFGLVCPAVGRVTAQGAIGDLRYAAPEILHGGAPSFRSDLYAAGLVLFEMLTGNHALASHSDNWWATHASVRPPALEALVPDAPRILAALVASLLAKSARDRPESASACSQTLRDARDELHATTANPTFEDGVDSLLRHLGGPAADEVTQVEPPRPSLLQRASAPSDTDLEPPSSRSG